MGDGRLWYTLKLRAEILERKTPIQPWEAIPDLRVTGRFFADGMASVSAIPTAEQIIKGHFDFFAHHQFDVGLPPKWFFNPFVKQNSESIQFIHWSKINDFANGDIKCLWELSRFAWVYPLCKAYGATGDHKVSQAFWMLLEDG